MSQPADGYTLMMGHIGLMTINAHLYKEMKFDLLSEFAPIIRRPRPMPTRWSSLTPLPIRSTKDPADYAKKSPTGLRFVGRRRRPLHMGF